MITERKSGSPPKSFYPLFDNGSKKPSIYDDCAEQNIQPKDVWQRAYNEAHGYSVTGLLRVKYTPAITTRPFTSKPLTVSRLISRVIPSGSTMGASIVKIKAVIGFCCCHFDFVWPIKFDFQIKLLNCVVGGTPILSATNSAYCFDFASPGPWSESGPF